MKQIYIVLIGLGLLAAAGCKDPYNAELRANDKSLLVVEGSLNSGALTTIRLSRTVQLSDTVVVKPELRATLTVEGRDNSVMPLTDRGRGVYTATLTGLQLGKDYRLHIRTAAGRNYLSDYVTVKPNPPIDSVSWRWEAQGVRLYATTHDPANATRYYRWEYDETWEIRSSYYSTWKKGSPTTVVPRKLPEEQIFQCWRNAASTNILLGSSAKLADDVMFEFPLLLIPNNDEKLAFRYSILVRQYAVSREAYEYFDLMRKNNEKQGSIFDAQPSDIMGNIHAVNDPAEPVVGYVTASQVHEQRIFIDRLQVPSWGWYQFCITSLVLNNPDSIEAFLGPDHQPYAAKYSDNNPNIITHWYASDAPCVDCTSRGGSTTKPSFW